jgi:collagen type I alpha
MSQIIINNNTTVTAGQTMLVSGFTLTDGTPSISIANGTATAGNALVTGAGALMDTAGYPIAVGRNGAGTLTLAAGGILQTGSLGGAPSVNIGTKVGATGTVVVTGSGSTLNSADQLNVGSTGSGMLIVSAGGTVNADAVGSAIAVIVASNAGSSGSVDITGSGSLLHATDQITVGKLAVGSMTIEAGGTLQVDNTNTAHVAMVIASSSTADGSRLLLTGAGSVLTASGFGSPGTVIVGSQGTATLDVAAGATLTASVVDAGHSNGAGSTASDGSGLIVVEGTDSRIDAGYALVDGGSVINGASLGSAISVTNGGFISAGQGILWAGWTLTVDSASTVEFGTARSAVAGHVQVDPGAILSGAGTIAVDNIVNAGTLAAAGGLLALDGMVTGAGTLQIGAGATLETTQSATGDTYFSGAGVLKLDAPLAFGGTLASAPLGATIDLVGAVGNDPVFVPEGGGEALQIATNIGTVDIPVSPGVATQALGFASDGAGGTLVTIACFAAGTLIETERGPIAAERLTPTDRVRSAFGGHVPVVWVGTRTFDCRRHLKPWDVLPIRIAAGAFGPGQPARDLRLSPDHAVFVDGVLMPIRYLLNGRTVRQEPAGRITYVHVELPAHDVLLAEGLPCESYLDTGNRGAFANAPGPIDAHPDFARAVWQSSACADLVTEGPRLAQARRALRAHAAALGHATTTDPALLILASGRSLPTRTDGCTWHAALPPGCGPLRIRSRTWTPAHLHPDATDMRTLGVAIAGLWLDAHAIALDDPRLGPGWHTPEPGWRWTGGDAVLNPAGAASLAFILALPAEYWDDDAPSRLPRAG